MSRIIFIFVLLQLASTNCFSQTTFQGITPGKSTRADVERVLGRAVKNTSATLAEYKPRWNANQIYVQYQTASPGAVVQRIELTCAEASGVVNSSRDDGCNKLHFAMQETYSVNVYMADAAKEFTRANANTRYTYYFGQPRFIVFTEPFINASGQSELRWAFYSRELFEAAAPQEPGCGGLRVLGEWDTNVGRMSIVREGVTIGSGLLASERVRGTFAKGNGTFTGILRQWTAEGEWKDDTGTGTMSISSGGRTISGDWKRLTGSGPPAGTLKGRCIDSAASNN